MKRKKGGGLIALLMALTAVSVGAAIRIYSITQKPLVPPSLELPQEESGGQEIPPSLKRNSLNFLLIGLDEVESVNRADSILFVRLDVEHRTIKAMSIPRDTRVQIRGRGQEKLNHAYAYGGMNLLKETVINLTGMPIDYYVILNYKSFPQIIDAVGGVTLDVHKAMRYTDKAQGLYINIAPGKQHMDGEQALKFVRFRMDALGDVGRIQRQQQFARAFIDKVLSPSIIPRLKDLAETIIAMIQTDVSLEMGLQLVVFAAGINNNDVEFFTMPGSAAYINRVSYWIPDLQKMAQRFNPEAVATLAAPLPESSSDAEVLSLGALDIHGPIAVLNGEGTSGLSAQFSQIFEKAGVEVGYIGNARHFDYRYSVVYYPEGKNSEVARSLAELCGISPSLVRPGSYSQGATLVLGHDHKRIRERLLSLPVEN